MSRGKWLEVSYVNRNCKIQIIQYNQLQPELFNAKRNQNVDQSSNDENKVEIKRDF